MKNLLTVLLAAIAITASGQSKARLSIGLEQDVLPYITDGYYGNLWVGKNHIRARAIIAHVKKPDFMIPDAFTNNKVTAYAFVADYFPGTEWKGSWISGGLVRWESAIQTNDHIFESKFNNWLLNGSIGHNWKFKSNFYVSAWAGCHLLIGGPSSVIVGPEVYHAPALNPEASVKIGWYFDW